MKKNITLKELSRSLNVSVSTVSKALKDSPEISISTKNKIRELAELNNYIPNANAQNLKNNQTRLIGVIIPEIHSPFFATALTSIEKLANKKNYQIIVCFSNDLVSKEQAIIDHLIKCQVDGFIISLAKETQAKKKLSHIDEIKKRNIPLVLFDRIDAKINCDKISLNEELQAELATNELFKYGCSRIMYLSGITQTSVNNQRKSGYRHSIISNRRNTYILEIETKEFPYNQLIQTVLKNKIDGILAADELSAIIAMRTLLKNGFKIPRDISIIGYNNGIMGENFMPSLTVVDQQAPLQGQIAMETIIDRIENKLLSQPIEYKLQSHLIYRESTPFTKKLPVDKKYLLQEVF